MKTTQYVAPYRTALNPAYFQCNDALGQARDAGFGFSLVPAETYKGEVVCAVTYTGSDDGYQYTEHPLPALFVDLPRRTLVYPTHKVTMRDISGAPERFVRAYLDEMSDYLAICGDRRAHGTQLREANNDGTWTIKKI